MASLYLTVAIPGAGKTTIAREFVANNPHVVYLSSDGLRAVLGKSEDDQTVSGQVFEYIRNMTEFFLRNNISVLVDATNYNRSNRASLVGAARRNNAFITAFVSRVPFDVSVARNKQRARVVPDFVLERMRNGFESPCLDEVDEIIFFDENGFID